MYKIAFDLRTTHQSGIHRYGTSLLRNMGHLLPKKKKELRIYVLHWPHNKQQIIASLGHTAFKEQIEFIAIADDYTFIRDSTWLRNWLKKEGVHIYYSSHYLVDHNLPIPFTFTIHDLVRIKYPAQSSYTDEAFKHKFGRAEFKHMQNILQQLAPFTPDNCFPPPGKEVFYPYFWTINCCLAQRSTHIFTGAKVIQKDIEEILAVPASKISVISDAIEPTLFYPRSVLHIAVTLQKFNLPPNYCLFVGLAHLRKRLPWLLENIAQHRANLPPNSGLVMVGGHYDDLYQGLHNLITSYSLHDFVTFTGRVSDEELACLYSGANALLISSVDEGFCLPALEALACGTEVIVPTIGAVQEAVGEYGHFYELTDTQQMVKLLTTAFNGTLPPRASSFKNRFSWSKSASQLLNKLNDYK